MESDCLESILYTPADLRVVLRPREDFWSEIVSFSPQIIRIFPSASVRIKVFCLVFFRFFMTTFLALHLSLLVNKVTRTYRNHL